MDNEPISDSRLLSFLQKHLAANYANDKRVKNVRYCGSQHLKKALPAVFVITDGKSSRLTGISRCHSSWSCPVCTAKRMAEYGSRIACALDALQKRYDMSAFMMTITIPHLKWMKGNDTYTILQRAWRAFSKECNPIRTAKYTLKKTIGEDGRAVGNAGEEKTYRKTYRAPFPNMRKKLGITHNIRVYEFTWSEKNGWHPHIHALFWLPNANFDKLNDGWEEKLSNSWWDIAERECLRYLNEKYPDTLEANAKQTQNLFCEWRRTPKTGHRNIFFSKDDHGKVKKVKSSWYISGWGGDNELTNNNQKIASEGHYAPHQILETAYKDITKRKQFLSLYVEYMQITQGKRRVMFSPNTGLNKVIDEWRKTNEWFETLKKKLMDKEHGKWRAVAWFNSQQWCEISYEFLVPKILELALLPDARKQIAHFLLQYNIKVSTKPHWYEKTINERVFENKIPYGTAEEARIATECQKNSITQHAAANSNEF